MGKFHKLSVKLCPLIFSKCVFGWIANLLHDIEGIYLYTPSILGLLYNWQGFILDLSDHVESYKNQRDVTLSSKHHNL